MFSFCWQTQLDKKHSGVSLATYPPSPLLRAPYFHHQKYFCTAIFTSESYFGTALVSSGRPLALLSLSDQQTEIALLPWQHRSWQSLHQHFHHQCCHSCDDNCHNDHDDDDDDVQVLSLQLHRRLKWESATKHLLLVIKLSSSSSSSSSLPSSSSISLTLPLSSS